MIQRDAFGAVERRSRSHRPIARERERHYVAAAVLAAAAIAAGSAAYGAESQAKAQSYQAKVNEWQAEAATNAAAVEAQNRAEHYRRIMATSRANVGASGVQPDTGSPLAVMSDSAEQAALDIARIRYAGQLRSTSFQQEAKLKTYEASQTRRAGAVNAGATLLTGAASAYGSYRRQQLRTRYYDDSMGGAE